MVTMAQSAAHWRITHIHVDRTHSLTHTHTHTPTQLQPATCNDDDDNQIDGRIYSSLSRPVQSAVGLEVVKPATNEGCLMHIILPYYVHFVL